MEGESWNSLRTIIGTVMGDIIISYPSKSSSPAHILSYHTGMIFGLLRKDNRLFSISDDRSLRMWSLDSWQQLDECYGHATRPFAICDGPGDIIFTGGQLFGTDCGFFGSFRFPLDVARMQKLEVVRPEFSVLSFIALSPDHYFILDSNRLYSIMEGECWNSLRTIIGTVMGDIIISYPSKSPSPAHILSYHTGMIFGLLRKDNRLFSISDDRSLRMWSLDKIHLLKLTQTGRGVIRSLLCLPQQLLFGTDCGFFGSFRFPLDVAKMQKLEVVRPEFSVLSFIALSPDHYFILDSNRLILLYFVNQKRACFNAVGQILDLFWVGNCVLLTLINYDNIGTIQSGLKEILSCATDHQDQLFLGTRKGSIIVAHDFKIEQIIRWAHGKKSIADIRAYESKLLSIGRDGKLRIWLIEDHIQLLFWRRPSAAIEMEWPCKFVGLYNELFIAGFHGPHLHLSSITSVATFKCGMEEFYVTGGIDAMLIVSQIRRSDAAYTRNLRQVFNMRLKGDCRLLSIQLLAVTPCIQFITTKHCVPLLDPLTNPGIITKIAIGSVNTPVRTTSFAAVSTAGLLYLWENVNDFDRSPDIIEVEKCGLSALDIYTKDGILYVGIGSESGSVTVFQTEKKQKFTKCTNRWHSATCTGVSVGVVLVFGVPVVLLLHDAPGLSAANMISS
ncbi:unnamed protein product [Gongylonema pulchrum]|uniref:tRNA (34-2'-O)-methyltransferase regulator WDR6 n=1 Tax=Gongylonema pulchrum TaxID=637853 RepID=A0A183DPX8_9BILA|nr:unnamed protein product [Gongylonema pulchrum]